MRGAVSIKITGYSKLIRKLNRLGDNVKREIGWEFQEAANEVRTLAIKKAPADESGIRNSISVKEVPGKVNKEFEVVVGRFYAPFVEFGTKSKYKAPAELGSWPAQFRNQKIAGNPIEALRGWVHRKKLATGRNIEAQEKSIAFLIWRKIKREGVKAQPYLFPSFFEVRRKLIARLENILKQETRR